MPAIQALLKGCLRHGPAPSYLIHLSGTANISDPGDYPCGVLNPKIWSDVANIVDIQSLPDNTIHRPVDKLLQEFAEQHGDEVKVAIVYPPDIYGEGTGAVKKSSYLVPLFAEESKKLGSAFFIGKGENVRSIVHIRDVAALYLLLVEDALEGGKKAGWGKDVSLK